MTTPIITDNIKLSANFSLKEFSRSNTARKNGIQDINYPNQEQLNNITALTTNLLQPLRDALTPANEYKRHYLWITSGFRSLELNALLSGSAGKSQHLQGQAADIVPINCKENVADLMALIVREFEYDQVILEHWGESKSPWVHISWNTEGNRNQALISYYDESSGRRRTKFKPYNGQV